MRINPELQAFVAHVVSKPTESKPEKASESENTSPASAGPDVEASLSPAAQQRALKQVVPQAPSDIDAAASAAAEAAAKIFGGGSGILRAQGGLDPDTVRALLGG